jgi:hypothetical protein
MGKGASPSKAEVQAGALSSPSSASSLPKPSQNWQLLQRHIWQCASLCLLLQIPPRHVSYSVSPRMPESQSCVFANSHAAQLSHPWQRHSRHDSPPSHEASQSFHLVSPFTPESHARNPWQNSQPLHLHVSQCEALLLAEQCEKHAGWSVSRSFAFTQVFAPEAPSTSVATVPSLLQNGHPRQRHIGQKPSACSSSHELLQPTALVSPGTPEWQRDEHALHPLHLQSLHASFGSASRQKFSQLSYKKSCDWPEKHAGGGGAATAFPACCPAQKPHPLHLQNEQCVAAELALQKPSQAS